MTRASEVNQPKQEPGFAAMIPGHQIEELGLSVEGKVYIPWLNDFAEKEARELRGKGARTGDMRLSGATVMEIAVGQKYSHKSYEGAGANLVRGSKEEQKYWEARRDEEIWDMLDDDGPDPPAWYDGV